MQSYPDDRIREKKGTLRNKVIRSFRADYAKNREQYQGTFREFSGNYSLIIEDNKMPFLIRRQDSKRLVYIYKIHTPLIRRMYDTNYQKF